MPVTSFHLIRHATTDALGVSLSGRSPVTLNAQGEAEAARLAGRFAGATEILTSPQLRTRQTAAAIGGTRVRVEAALDEVDFGAWTGRSFASLHGEPDWAVWNARRGSAPAPGGETMIEVQARAASLVVGLHATRPGGCFVLVSHADVLKSVVAWALGLPIDLMQRLEISPASETRLTLGEGGPVLNALNRVWDDRPPG